MQRFIFRWGPALLIMAFIFIMSAQPAKTLKEVGLTNTLLRKAGHMTEYATLSLAVLRGFDKVNRRNMLLALGAAVLYAISDEVHQIFVPGRGPLVTDVLIDASGSALGLLAFILWSQLRRLVFWYPTRALPNPE